MPLECEFFFVSVDDALMILMLAMFMSLTSPFKQQLHHRSVILQNHPAIALHLALPLQLHGTRILRTSGNTGAKQLRLRHPLATSRVGSIGENVGMSHVRQSDALLQQRR